jgi:hypothetical protein
MRRWSSTRWTCSTRNVSTASASSRATATSPGWRHDCDKFIYVENLTYPEDPIAAADTNPAAKKAVPATQLKRDSALVNLLRNAAEATSDDDGGATLASVGHIITNQQPDFDSRTYGYAKLSDLVSATTLFELDRRRDSRRQGRPARHPRQATPIGQAMIAGRHRS